MVFMAVCGCDLGSLESYFVKCDIRARQAYRIFPAVMISYLDLLDILRVPPVQSSSRVGDCAGPI